jgi:putative salt-induced outer membrane protein YdiY
MCVENIIPLLPPPLIFPNSEIGLCTFNPVNQEKMYFKVRYKMRYKSEVPNEKKKSEVQNEKYTPEIIYI